MKVSITESFHPKNKSQWRSWLAKNHRVKSEIWVVFFKKATGKQTVTYQEALDETLCFGWIDGIEKGIDQQKFAIRFTPRAKKSNWSETNIKRYEELLRQGLVTEVGKKAFENRVNLQ